MIRVLYVDDEEALLEITKLYLERNGDLSVDTALSAMIGLEKFRESSYDIIVSDYQMPEMDGIAFLKAVRQQSVDIPFILFTGRGREEVVIEAINNGVDFYIQKGGDPKAQFAELTHKIQKAVSRRRADLSRIESEKRLADIINFLPDATFAIDRDGRVIAWNRAIEEMTGIPAADMLGKGTYEYAIPFYGTRRKILIDLIFEPDEILSQNYAHIVRDKDILIADSTLPRPRGMSVTLMGKASPLYNSSGDIVGAIEAIRDITERQKAENDLRAAYEQIAANEEELRDQLEKLVTNQEALAHSEGKFRDIVETSPDLIWEIDERGVLTYVSPRFTDLIGYTPEETLGKPIFSFLPEEELPHLRELFSSITHTRELPGGFDVIARCKDGNLITIEIRATIQTDSRGQLSGFRGIARDITEKRNAEKALHESERRFRELAELLPQGIYEADTTGRMTYVNPCALKMYGYTEEDIEHGLYALTMIAPHDRERTAAAIRRMAEEGIHLKGESEYMALRKDGTTFPVTIFSTPIYRDDRITGIRGILIDTTAQKEAENALTESERRFRELADLLPQGIYESDLSGRVTYANRMALEVSGYTEEDIEQGLNVFSVISPEESQRAVVIYRQMIERGDRVQGDEDYTGLRKDGTSFPASIFSSPIIRDGEIIGVRGIIIDITERKKTEQYLQAVNVQLAASSEELQSQYDSLARNEQQIRGSEVRLKYMLGFYERSRQSEKEILSYAIEGAGAVTDSPLGYLAFLNDDETELTMYAWSQNAMKECAMREKPIIYPVEKTGLWGDAVRHRRPVITNDYQAPNPGKKGYPAGHPHILRHMNVPIMDGDHIVMVAGVANKPSGYSEHDVSQLTLLMQALWQVLERRRTEDELRAANEHLAASEKELRDQYQKLAFSEYQVRQSEERYRSIIENIQDIVYRSDAAGNLVMISPSFITTLGYDSAEECIGKNIAGQFWVYPEKRKEFLEELMKSGSVTDYEILLKKKDGTPVPVSTSSHLYYNKDGTIAGVEGVIHDMSAIRDAQEQIQLLATLNDISPASIVVHTPDGEILYANERTFELHGSTREEFMALNLHQIDAPVSEHLIDTRVEQLKSKGMASFDVEHFRKDGTLLPLHVTARLTQWKDRVVILSVATDITERKRMEDAVREANQKLNLLSEITRHDVANQLTILQGLIEIATTENSAPAIADLLKKIDATARAISHQVEFTRTYQDLGIHTPEWLRLDDIIERISCKNVHYTPHCRKIEIYADPMLDRVFQNLFENAIRHGKRVTKISVHCEHGADGLVIVVEDDGIGIPSGEKEKIFEKGFGSNTGFGLFLAREILALTGSAIRETGVQGTGARFEITIPEGKYRSPS